MAVPQTSRSSRARAAPAVCIAAAFLAASIVAAPPASAAADKLGNYSSARSMALQPNGRIVVAAATRMCDLKGPFEPCADTAVVVIRYLPSGRIDHSFGGGDGLVMIPFGGEYFKGDYPGVSGLAIQDDGKIVVGAVTLNPRSFLLVRLSARGRLDRSFGEGGKVTIPPERFVASDSGNGIVVSADGLILVAGSHDPAGLPGPEFAAARFLPDGTLDPSFGAAGVASVRFTEEDDFLLATTVEQANAIGLRPDGRILLGGGLNGFRASVAVAQLDASGQPDQGFANGGRAVFGTFLTSPTGGGTSALGLEVQPDGSALLAGYRSGGLILARLSASGTLVDGFGDAGVVLSGALNSASDLALQGEKILVTGPGGDLYDQPLHVVVVRYNPDGSWDQSFVGGAGLTNLLVAGFESAAHSLEIAKGGRILVAGYVSSDECELAGSKGTGSSLCEAITLLRLKPDGRLDRKFGRGGIVTAPRINLCEKAPTARCDAGKRARP